MLIIELFVFQHHNFCNYTAINQKVRTVLIHKLLMFSEYLHFSRVNMCHGIIGDVVESSIKKHYQPLPPLCVCACVCVWFGYIQLRQYFLIKPTLHIECLYFSSKEYIYCCCWVFLCWRAQTCNLQEHSLRLRA